MTLLVLGVLLAVLFVCAYATKRRFGVLALVVVVSYMMSQVWAIELADLATMVELPPEVDLPVSAVVSLLVLSVPSVLVLFMGGPVYHTKRGRFMGSLLYVAVVAVFGVLSLALSPDGQLLTGVLVDQVLLYQNYLVTAVFAAAIVDIVLARNAHTSDAKAKH